MQRRARCSMIVVLISFALFSFSGNVHSDSSVPEKGSSFPVISLPVPEKDSEKSYLGLSEKGTFTISDIKASVLIIEIMSMYCPYCQKEAPLVNDLFQIIDRDAVLRDKVRIIGIGAGNTPFEIDVFRNQFHVPFPIFEDRSFAIHRKIGEVRTPYFFVLKMNADKTNKIIYSKVGTIGEPVQFLNLIREEAVLK